MRDLIAEEVDDRADAAASRRKAPSREERQCIGIKGPNEIATVAATHPHLAQRVFVWSLSIAFILMLMTLLLEGSFGLWGNELFLYSAG